MQDVTIARHTYPSIIDPGMSLSANERKIPGNPNRIALIVTNNASNQVAEIVMRTGMTGDKPQWYKGCVGQLFTGVTPRLASVFKIEDYGQLITSDIYISAPATGGVVTVIELLLNDTSLPSWAKMQ